MYNRFMYKMQIKVYVCLGWLARTFGWGWPVKVVNRWFPIVEEES